ncbi:MAG: molybdenum cofactor biosynthesis protein B [Alphaproteobacteria bacterium]|nr:molybdenum cofactor biosynthesis protein B [Alphaproteobacteria bacterium]
MTGRLNEDMEFVPIGIAVMTISDSRTAENDKSGDLLASRVVEAGHNLISRTIVHDEVDEIRAMTKIWIEDKEIDAVITTGGTGVTGRDVTPEAMRGIFDKEIEGFGEMFRWLSFAKIGTSALQSRAIGGVAGGTYIFSLPGSPSACRDGWDDILKWQLDIRHLPCNFVEIMPRLMERGIGGRSS